jgi:hypothetical protein
MDNQEKMATKGTKDEEKQNKNTTQYVLDATIHKQTQHNMCWTPLYTNKHSTICVEHHYTQTNTTQYVFDATIHKQTQHNMCWAPLYTNKHK